MKKMMVCDYIESYGRKELCKCKVSSKIGGKGKKE